MRAVPLTWAAVQLDDYMFLCPSTSPNPPILRCDVGHGLDSSSWTPRQWPRKVDRAGGFLASNAAVVMVLSLVTRVTRSR
jgi:hypothetical protein